MQKFPQQPLKENELEKELHQKKIALLWGGWSDEREISHDSACACGRALQEAGFSHIALLDVAASSFLSDLAQGNFDVAFVAMHGPYGEDGCIQGLLETLHIPHTFSGVLASALASDKARAKILFQEAGIATPASYTLSREEFKTLCQKVDDSTSFWEVLCEHFKKRNKKTLHFPLFVKPANNGSSYGITKVEEGANKDGSLQSALELAFAKGEVTLVEEAVLGTEISVPVLGSQNPRALPIIEIVMESDYYDLKTKYEPSELHHVIPARLEESVYKKAQQAAILAHVALGCEGCSRSDFIVTEEGEPVILETNTIPGMTETSLLPDSARRAGISFPTLCEQFVRLALGDGEGA